MATAVLAGAAVVSAGVSAYTAFSGSPDMQYTTPASYYDYDEDGNLTGSQVWDSSSNAYVTRTYSTAEQKAEKQKMTALRTKLLGYLNETPEDRQKAYTEYAESYSKALHSDADKQYDKLKSSTEESMAAKGMMGSKAYADMMSDLNEQQIGMNTDIATASELAKENLASQDKSYWLSALNALNNQKNADAAIGIQKAGIAANNTAQGTAALSANNALLNSSRYANWQNKINSLNNLSSSLGNTSSGLAFLYGYKGSGNPDNVGDNYLQTHASFYGY